MKIFLLAAFMLCNINLAAISLTANAQTGAKKSAPNEIVVEETKTVVIPPKSKSKTQTKPQIGKTSSTTTQATKNGFSHTTTTTQVVPAASPAPAAATTTTQTYTAPVITAPATSSTDTTASTATVTATPATPAAPAEPPSPWKISYFAEYFGPKLSNIELDKTQGGIDGATTGYGRIDHYLKTLYAVSKNNLIGFQFRARSPFDPTGRFGFRNIRIVGVWKNMVDTPDVNLGSQFDIEPPTTDAARQGGNIMNFNIRLNWTLKTSLRNWSFTAQTMIRPMFYETARPDNTDLYVGLFPWITMDLGPSTQLLFDCSFDTSHTYSASFFDLGSDDPDYIGVGINWDISPHFSTNPELRFFTGNISFKSAYLYLGFSAVL